MSVSQFVCAGCGREPGFEIAHSLGSSSYCAACYSRMRCYRHPQRWTRVKCQHCDRYLCEECVITDGTSTGAFCEEHVPEGFTYARVPGGSAQAAAPVQAGTGGYPPAVPQTVRVPQSFAAVSSPILGGIAWIWVLLIFQYFYWAFIPAGLAILMGFVGFNKVKNSYGEKRGRGWAVLGIILGIAAIVFEIYLLFIRFIL